jgi:hypothetical protein
MAYIDRSKSISGAIGNVVFRKVGTKQILQVKSGPIRQTKETKVSGSEFRQCSSWAKWLRLGLGSFLAKHTDSTMHGRFTGQFYTTLQGNTSFPKGERTPLNSDMASLAEFEFNTNSPFRDYFVPEITTVLNDQHQVVVTVPEFNAKAAVEFPQDTHYAELLIYAIATDFQDHTGFTDGYMILPIENKSETIAETVWASPAFPQGHLVLVCAKLLFYNTNRFTEKQYINSKECSPAMIGAALKT